MAKSEPKDASQLTLGEVAKVEETCGIALSEMDAPDKPKGKALAALVWVFKRREDRAFKFTDALDMTLAEAQDYLGLEDEDATAALLPSRAEGNDEQG